MINSWDGVEAPHLGVEGAVQPGGTEPGEQFVGAGVDHGLSAADRDVGRARWPGGSRRLRQ